VFSDQASIASWALFTLHRKKLYEYRNANEQNISVKMSSPEHYPESIRAIQFNRRFRSYGAKVVLKKHPFCGVFLLFLGF
ncbi:hypothetical protein APX81_01160, partial [Escherichia coli]